MARPYLIVNRLSMIFQLNFFLQRGFAGGVEAEEDEEEDGESPEGGASVAEEGQGDAYDGAKADYHADVNTEVEDEVGCDAVGVHAGECAGLSLGDGNHPQNQRDEEKGDDSGAYEAFFLAYGAEDEVGMLLGDVFELGLGAVEESFSGKSAGTDGNLGLVDVVTGAAEVFDDAEGYLYSHLLVGLEDFVEGDVDGEKECYGEEGRADGNPEAGAGESEDGEIDGRNADDAEHDGEEGEVDAEEGEGSEDDGGAAVPYEEVPDGLEALGVEDGHDDGDDYDHHEDGELTGRDGAYHCVRVL